MTTGTALLTTGILILTNAYFVAAEFAIVKVRRSRIKELADQGRRRARIVLAIKQRLDAYLSAAQLGITLASLALGWIGEPTIARLIEPWLRPLGAWAGASAHALALGVSLVTITWLHTTLGEQVPKVLALNLAEPMALWTAPLLRLFYLVAFPLIWLLNGSANAVLRLFGVRSTAESEALHSPGELRMVLQQVKIEPGARRLIDRVFDYTQRVARHVMTLRRDVVVLVAGRPFEENLTTAVGNQYTRYPLVDPRNDTVLGYVHLKDIVAALASGRKPRRMREIARQPIYVAEDTRLEWLRREFQRRRVHIAIVLGAQDRFVGIVTMEDLIEEFVGEIQDEQDVGEIPPLVRAPNGHFEAEGRLTLDVAARDLGLKLVPQRPEIETVGAYLEAAIGRIPQPGDTHDVEGYQLTAIEIRDGHIRRLRGVPLRREDEAEDLEGAPPTPEPRDSHM